MDKVNGHTAVTNELSNAVHNATSAAHAASRVNVMS